jgi:hypothetical protein
MVSSWLSDFGIRRQVDVGGSESVSTREGSVSAYFPVLYEVESLSAGIRLPTSKYCHLLPPYTLIKRGISLSTPISGFRHSLSINL